MGETPTFQRIYNLVRQIPPGKVATYGLIARYVGGISAQMVGFALAALKEEGVPWQRVVNAQGMVSPRGFGFGGSVQRSLLEEEGVHFDLEGRVDLEAFGWKGPDGRWEYARRKKSA
jgi:methylated-DNA-protein-cysteine methyltransferase-like protein